MFDLSHTLPCNLENFHQQTNIREELLALYIKVVSWLMSVKVSGQWVSPGQTFSHSSSEFRTIQVEKKMLTSGILLDPFDVTLIRDIQWPFHQVRWNK